MIAAFFGAPYGNLFFLLIGFLSVMWTMALFWTWRNASGIRIYLGTLSPITAGSHGSLVVELQSQTRTRFNTEVKFDLGSDLQLTGSAPFWKGSTRVELATPELSRGIYNLANGTLSSTYPFGMLRKGSSLQAAEELVVYPAPHEDANSARTAEDLLRELLGSDSSVQGDLQPTGLRDHKEGESMRAVHWRASARRAKLVVQEWDGGGPQGLEVVLDRRCSHEELEEALKDLSTLVYLARESKQALAIRTQGLNETFGEGFEDWTTAQRFMASADLLAESKSGPPAAAPEVLRLPRSCSHA